MAAARRVTSIGALLALVPSVVACSLATSLDGVFGDAPDATAVDAASDATAEVDPEGDGGQIFPTDDGGPPPCGAPDEPCCASKCNAGSTCSPDDRCIATPPCGAETQVCCGGSACNAGLECRAGKCEKTPAPVACGGPGQGCCTGGACVSGHVCNGTSCVGCGSSGQPCCGGATCGGGLVCANGACAACGGSRQPCCLGGIGGADLWCGSGACQPLCYLRCCDESLQRVKVYTAAQCRDAYPACADHGRVKRIQYEGNYLYTRDTPCP